MIVAPATSMTAARIEVRTGATPEPGPGWAPFHEPGLTGGPVDQLGRYAQYRLRLSGGSDVTPEVREVRLELGDPR
jgi:hypothetical protein